MALCAVSNLRKTQSEFTRCVAKLIEFAYEQDLELTFGDAFRSPEECSRLGFASSCHGIRLAIDFNLFKAGVYLSTTKDHAVLGEHWETLHELSRWGGRFDDGGHYSFEWQGIK